MGNCILTRSKAKALREWQHAVQNAVGQQSIRLNNLEEALVTLSDATGEKDTWLENTLQRLDTHLKIKERDVRKAEDRVAVLEKHVALLKSQVSGLMRDQKKTDRRVNALSSQIESEVHLGNALRGVIHRLSKFCNSCLKRVEHFSRRLQNFEGKVNAQTKKHSSTDTFGEQSRGVVETLIRGICESELEKEKIINFAEEILHGLQHSASFALQESSKVKTAHRTAGRKGKH